MPKFVATCDSFGANCAYYKKGQEYEFPSCPKEYFAPVEKSAKEPEVREDHSVPMAYMSMTIAELAKIADAKGVTIQARWNKDKIIQAILDK